ncbi:hypothetical protein V6N12_068536 [Hibiscus sabdariffa]|uniref:Putative plant transposon protein domain-containing protein n=1 Tax=Hibiscus sabdariffa TaxID=183260 RepID=A0ABR2FQ98_9ROSI
MATTSTPIKVFFNEEIQRKYEDNFSSRPFIFEKSFNLKNEHNVRFTPEFSSVVAKHKWESFIQQKRGDLHQTCPSVLRALNVKRLSFSYDSRCLCSIDEGYINSMFDLVYVDDEHVQFINSMTTTKQNKILANLCQPGRTWTTSANGNCLVKRVALKSQARGWNQFLKSSLMPTTHNDIVSEERMELLHSIIMRRQINVG